MDFYCVITKIDELKKELKQMVLSTIEEDIIKTKLSELYLLLFEKQEVKKTQTSYPPTQKETIVEEDTKDFSHPHSTINTPHQPDEQETQQRKPSNVDYKSLVETFLEKEPVKQPSTEDQSLLSKLSQSKIVDLKRSIAMNDRFIFIKELFNNDFDTYNRYINDLNSCQNMEQAEQYLSKLKNQYAWDEENETVQFFLSLISRKLS